MPALACLLLPGQALALEADLRASASAAVSSGYIAGGVATGPSLELAAGMDYVVEVHGEFGGFLRYGEVTGIDWGPGLAWLAGGDVRFPIRLSDRVLVKLLAGPTRVHVLKPWGSGYCCELHPQDVYLLDAGVQVVYGAYGMHEARTEIELRYEEGGWAGSDAGWGFFRLRAHHRFESGFLLGGDVAFGRVTVEVGYDVAARHWYARSAPAGGAASTWGE